MNTLLAALALTASIMVGPEDSAGWHCKTDGNRVCGPNNAESVVAGCYDDRGALVAAWPCYVVVRSDGEADVYVP